MTPESHFLWLLSLFLKRLGCDFLIWHICLLIIQISTYYRSWIGFQFFAFFIITTLSFRGANFIFTLRNFIALGVSGQWGSLHQTSALALSYGFLFFSLVRVLICTRQGDSRFNTFFILWNFSGLFLFFSLCVVLSGRWRLRTFREASSCFASSRWSSAESSSGTSLVVVGFPNLLPRNRDCTLKFWRRGLFLWICLGLTGILHLSKTLILRVWHFLHLGSDRSILVRW